MNVRANGISAFIMVFNEARSISACLDALAWIDEIVLLDSFSTDDSCAIARRYPNVRIVQRAFTDFGDQRQFGLRLPYSNPWVLVIDADEIVSPELAAEIRSTVAAPESHDCDLYYLRRQTWFAGKALRHNLPATFWIPRLVRPERVRVEGRVHERIRATGRTGRLRAYLDHHQFDKGVDHWFGRRQRYAQLEAAAIEAGELRSNPIADLLSGDTLRRRAVVKRLFQALPMRWLAFWLYNVVICGAWRDGMAGLRYVGLEAESHRRAEVMKMGPSSA
jgi:glycosyltransferase involved in cell wall biosynthesis